MVKLILTIFLRGLIALFDLDRILSRVQKPARYTGGELNEVKKDPGKVKIRYCFCFPDVYEIGMSHLGMKILYSIINEREDTYCERAFAPWFDMEEELVKNNIPLFSLETKTPLNQFDLLGFTLQYEMSYSNILNMLKLSNIPLLSKDRKEGDPFVYAGGPCAYNPEPLADFMDFYTLGEGEEITNEVLDVYKKWKEEGGTRHEFLCKIARIEGVYVPSFYDVEYNDDGTIKSFAPNNEYAKPKVKKRIIKDLENVYYPDKFIVPYMDIVHDRIMLEVFRGCIRGCRFCQAGMIYRPVREKSPKRLLSDAKKLIESTGYEEISLSSLSTSDYTGFKELAEKLLCVTESEKINMSLPSLRVDNFSLELMDKVQKVRKSSITLAPEAGSQRMRDVINKQVTKKDLLKSAELAFRGGWTSIKLYFMIGLPYETLEDVVEIANLGKEVVDVFYTLPKEERKRGVNVTLSVSSFVPKPFTPFQWARQNTIEELHEKQMAVKKNIKSKHIKYNYHESKLSVLEGVFARGDRRLGKVLLKAHELGAKFDSWNEGFDMEKWEKAFLECGMDYSFYTRERSYEEILPWDFIDIGITKKFLQSENERAKNAQTTPNCRVKCASCGAAVFGGGVCFE